MNKKHYLPFPSIIYLFLMPFIPKNFFFLFPERSITSKPLNPFSEAPPTKRAKLDHSETPSTSSSSGTAAAAAAAAVSENGDKKSELPSFWIPSLTPQAKATLVQKPVSIFFLSLKGTLQIWFC